MTAEELVRRVAAEAHGASGDLEPARRAARETFRRPGSGEESLMSRFLGWLDERAHSVFPDVHLGGGVSGLLTWAVLAVLAVLVVRVLVAAIRNRGARAAREDDEASPEGRMPPFDRARAAALRVADADPREALRLLYAALLAEVGRRRGWRPIPGRTNWTFVRRLGPATPEGAALGECTRLFEGRVYGDEPASPADVHRLDGLAAEVLV